MIAGCGHITACGKIAQVAIYARRGIIPLMALGEDVMTVSEVSAVLGVNDSRVRQLARAGSLKGERRGRDWFFLRADVEEYERTRPRGRGRPPGGRKSK